MKLNDAFPSQYVSAPDLKGREIQVVIERVAMEELKEMDGSVIHKPACKFQNAEKKMILNITNWNLIAAVYGDDSDMWIGRELVLFPTRVQFGNKMVDAIRVRAPSNAPTQTTTAPITNDAFGDAPGILSAPANPLDQPGPATPVTPAADDPLRPPESPLGKEIGEPDIPF